MESANDKYERLLRELWAVAHEENPYYDIDKVKDYGVYVWTKGDDGQNVFDICFDGIVFYDKEHVIPDDAKPWVEKIQRKVIEIRDHVYGNLDEFPGAQWLKKYMED